MKLSSNNLLRTGLVFCFWLVHLTACHSGKLKLTFTSPNVISTSPQNALISRLISQFFCNLNSSKNFTYPLGMLILAPGGLSDTTVLCAHGIATSASGPLLASPQTSFGVRLSRIHFSPVGRLVPCLLINIYEF